MKTDKKCEAWRKCKCIFLVLWTTRLLRPSDNHCSLVKQTVGPGCVFSCSELMVASDSRPAHGATSAAIKKELHHHDTRQPTNRLAQEPLPNSDPLQTRGWTLWKERRFRFTAGLQFLSQTCHLQPQHTSM